MGKAVHRSQARSAKAGGNSQRNRRPGWEVAPGTTMGRHGDGATPGSRKYGAGTEGGGRTWRERRQ